MRSEEHTSELQSRRDVVCRLLLAKKNKRSFAHVSEHRSPGRSCMRDRSNGQLALNVRLDADREQFSHLVLRWHGAQCDLHPFPTRRSSDLGIGPCTTRSWWPWTTQKYPTGRCSRPVTWHCSPMVRY